MKKSRSRRLFLGSLVALIAFAAQLAQAGPIAFVYNTAGTTTATNFKSFLDGRGYAISPPSIRSSLVTRPGI